MRSRVLTALALTALLVVAILFSPPGVTAAILGLILLIGAWEWSAFLALALPWRLTYVLALGLLAYAGWRYTPEAAPFRLMLQLAIAWWRGRGIRRSLLIWWRSTGPGFVRCLWM